MATLTQTDKTVAINILKTLGGNRFLMMTGAKNLTCDNDSMTAKIMRNAKGITHFKVKLNGLDLYDVTFFKVRGGNIKIEKEVTNIYDDMLRGTFELYTGLYTSL